MVPEALLGRHGPSPCSRVVAINFPEFLKDVPDLLREAADHIDEVPSAVGQAVAQDRLELFIRGVSVQPVAHLDRWTSLPLPFRKHFGQVFAGVLPAREEERDSM